MGGAEAVVAKNGRAKVKNEGDGTERRTGAAARLCQDFLLNCGLRVAVRMFSPGSPRRSEIERSAPCAKRANGECKGALFAKSTLSWTGNKDQVFTQVANYGIDTILRRPFSSTGGHSLVFLFFLCEVIGCHKYCRGRLQISHSPRVKTKRGGGACGESRNLKPARGRNRFNSEIFSSMGQSEKILWRPLAPNKGSFLLCFRVLCGFLRRRRSEDEGDPSCGLLFCVGGVPGILRFLDTVDCHARINRAISTPVEGQYGQIFNS